MTRAVWTFIVIFGPALCVFALYIAAAYVPWPARHRRADVYDPHPCEDC